MTKSYLWTWDITSLISLIPRLMVNQSVREKGTKPNSRLSLYYSEEGVKPYSRLLNSLELTTQLTSQFLAWLTFPSLSLLVMHKSANLNLNLWLNAYGDLRMVILFEPFPPLEMTFCIECHKSSLSDHNIFFYNVDLFFRDFLSLILF